MALDNSAILKVGTGAFYTAEIGTELPTSILEPGSPWENMGHTSLEDILNSASEGGDQTTLSSLQNRNLRTTVAARTESFNINLLQFDSDSLKLYYGDNAVVTPEGSVRPAIEPVPAERAWLFVFRDGDRVGAIYAPKASFFRGDDFAISDTESLSRLNLRITPLAVDGNAHAIEFVPPKAVTSGGGDGGETGA